jgi:hypothetical protein
VSVVTTPPLVPDLSGVEEQSTPEQARARVERIRAGLPVYMQMRRDIADAYIRRDWVALEYDSWSEYLEGEFGGLPGRLVAAERQVAVAEFREAGMSIPAIAAAVNAGVATVHRDLTAAFPNGKPETVVGTDGKRYAAVLPPREGAPTDAPSPGPVADPVQVASESVRPADPAAGDERAQRRQELVRKVRGAVRVLEGLSDADADDIAADDACILELEQVVDDLSALVWGLRRRPSGGAR